jgi:outer membrane protein assembly factor BamD
VSTPAHRRAPARLAALGLALGVIAAFGPGCAGFSFFGSGGPSYATTAKGNYEKALVEMKRKNWPEAIKLFQYSKSKFSFSKYAALSELGIAEAELGRERYAEGIDGLRSFIKAHPTHEMVVDGYAAYRIGEAYHKEIPSEWFLVPPAYEKDQGPVRDALRELSAFLSEYADSPHADKAKKLEEDCVRRLADHELYVADFYLKKKRPQAAIARLEGLAHGDFLPKLPAESGAATGRLGQVAHDYLRTHLEARVLLQLARTQLVMSRYDEARASCDQIIAAHGGEPQARPARELLVEIQRRQLVDPAAKK